MGEAEADGEANMLSCFFFQQKYKAQDDGRHAEECHYGAQSFPCTLISTKILVNTYQMRVHRYCTDGPAYADKQG